MMAVQKAANPYEQFIYIHMYFIHNLTVEKTEKMTFFLPYYGIYFLLSHSKQ